mgnify:CR=1 FL=1
MDSVENMHIVETVVDENNFPVVLADNNITCTVTGKARLLGLEGGDPRDMDDYTGNVQRAYQGRLLANVLGEGTVTFSSPLLQPAVVNLTGN